MDVLMPSRPVRIDELLGFLREIAHIINSADAKDTIKVRVNGRNAAPVVSCCVRYSDEYEEMEFVVKYTDSDGDPVDWHEPISSLHVKGYCHDSFRLKLGAYSKTYSSVAIYAV